MLISYEFVDGFLNVTKGTKGSIDAEWKTTIDNLKVMITLKHNDLDPSDFDLYYKTKKLQTETQISSLNYSEGDQIFVKKHTKTTCGCY